MIPILLKKNTEEIVAAVEAVETALGTNVTETVIRAAAILTTSYVAATVVDVSASNQITLKIRFTIGSADSCQIKMEISEDQSLWEEQAYYYMSGDNAVYTAYPIQLESSCNIFIPIPVATTYVRFSARAVTDATGTSLALRVAKAKV